MKAATTSLYSYLRQHPEIFMPTIKEPMFFNNIISRGKKGKGVRRKKIKSIQEYYNLFEKVENEKAIGEASPGYIYNKECPNLIKENLEDVKIIAILRQPVRRAYSNFLHAKRAGKEPISDFISAFDAEDERIRDEWEALYHYKSKGYYFTQLKRYYDTFAEKDIKIILFEDFITQPKETLKDLFAFLNVDDSFIVNTNKKANVSGSPKGILGWIVMKMRYYQIYPNIEFSQILSKPILEIIKKIIYSEPKKIQEDTVRQLTNLHYIEEIKSLQVLIKRDLTKWLR